MKICVVCVTYNRPGLLGQMIRCFERQDYADRAMVILDDADQYPPTHGDRWRLVSVADRFATLGEKRNAAARLAPPDADALAIWDDDDLYMPWALRASVAALEHAAWSRPSLVLHPLGNGSLRQHSTGGLFHSGWAYRRDAFDRAGGYPAMNNGEDQELGRRLRAAWRRRGRPYSTRVPAISGLPLALRPPLVIRRPARATRTGAGCWSRVPRSRPRSRRYGWKNPIFWTEFTTGFFERLCEQFPSRFWGQAEEGG